MVFHNTFGIAVAKQFTKLVRVLRVLANIMDILWNLSKTCGDSHELPR